MNENNGTRWKPWYVLALLFVVAALNYLDRGMIATMRKSVVASIPMSDAQFGFLTTVFTWGYGICSPITGFIADRFKKGRVIIAGLFVWSLITFLTGHVTTYEQLLVTRAGMGVSEAIFIPAALAMVIDIHKPATQSLAIGILISGTMVGSSLGFLGGNIAEHHSWNAAFQLFGLIGVLYAVVLVFALKERSRPLEQTSALSPPPKEQVRLGEALRELTRKRAFFYLVLLFPLPSIVGWMVLGWLPTFYAERFHLSQTAAGAYATVWLYPASILGLVFGGFLSDRWQKKNPYARVLVPMIGFAVSAVSIFMIGYTQLLWVTVSLFLIYGFARVFNDANLMPMLSMVIDGRYRAMGYGVINMAAVFAGGLSTYVAGALRDAHVGLTAVFQYASLALGVGIGLLYLVMREVKKQVDEGARVEAPGLEVPTKAR